MPGKRQALKVRNPAVRFDSAGYNAFATASNQARIGNSSVTGIGGYAAWTNLSDKLCGMLILSM
jgi:hypothetical protein